MAPVSMSWEPPAVDGPALLRTSRLVLRPLEDGQVDELFALTSDPATARYDPALLHTDRSQATALVRRAATGRQRCGLAPWLLHLRGGHAPAPEGPARRLLGAGAPPASSPWGPLVGYGGCSLLRNAAWNLSYRLAPRWWGRGLAQELIAAARRAAADVRPDLPVVAALLEGDAPSLRAAERAGLRRVWTGPDAHGPDPDAVLLLLADRPVDGDLVTALTRA